MAAIDAPRWELGIVAAVCFHGTLNVPDNVEKKLFEVYGGIGWVPF